MFHNILVAVDGSADADAALAHAIDLAESEHTRLTLMTAVAELPPTAYLMVGEETGQVSERAHRWAEAVIRQARDRVPADLPVTTVLSEQPIRPALCRQILETPAAA
jgi:nucleotide-binding universal stress UspA family protein